MYVAPNTFQSTQPSQAVTTLAEVCAALPIFQSTQPSQAVTQDRGWAAGDLDISIHTAFAGCDQDDMVLVTCRTISIHTAFAGCDPPAPEAGCGLHHFNPHSLRRL